MAIDYRGGVSILLLIFYLPALAIAILLSVRHGFTKSACWRFMIIFTLARILSACFQLATINQPQNVSLYVGYSVLIGIAISPLELVAFGYAFFLQILSSIQVLEKYPMSNTYSAHYALVIFAWSVARRTESFYSAPC